MTRSGCSVPVGDDGGVETTVLRLDTARSWVVDLTPGSHGHGADHVLPAFVAPSITIPVIDGRPALGQVRLSFLAG